MTDPSDYADVIGDIRTAAAKAQEFVEAMSFDAFQRDDRTTYAVVRALEVMGEATKRVPPELREQYPSVPWRAMAGIRDRLIHGYENVNLEIVWKAVTEELPALMPEFDRILQDITSGQS